jgi:hypothetical protein
MCVSEEFRECVDEYEGDRCAEMNQSLYDIFKATVPPARPVDASQANILRSYPSPIEAPYVQSICHLIRKYSWWLDTCSPNILQELMIPAVNLTIYSLRSTLLDDVPAQALKELCKRLAKHLSNDHA